MAEPLGKTIVLFLQKYIPFSWNTKFQVYMLPFNILLFVSFYWFFISCIGLLVSYIKKKYNKPNHYKQWRKSTIISLSLMTASFVAGYMMSVVFFYSVRGIHDRRAYVFYPQLQHEPIQQRRRHTITHSTTRSYHRRPSRKITHFSQKFRRSVRQSTRH